MKKQAYVLMLVSALGLGAATLSAQAPAAPALKLGVINFQRAVIESTEGKKAAQKLQEQVTPKRNELQSRQAEIEKLQKQLREQEKTLSDEARGNLVRQVESKTKEFTRINEDYSNEAQQAEQQVVNEIGQKVYKVLDEYAKKNGYHVVLDLSSQGPAFWATGSVDVTDEIIKLINAQPASAPAAATPAAAAPAPAAKAPAAKSAPAAAGTAAPAAKKPAAPPR